MGKNRLLAWLARVGKLSIAVTPEFRGKAWLVD
jgi:hypothetical protein